MLAIFIYNSFNCYGCYLDAMCKCVYESCFFVHSPPHLSILFRIGPDWSIWLVEQGISQAFNLLPADLRIGENNKRTSCESVFPPSFFPFFNLYFRFKIL